MTMSLCRRTRLRRRVKQLEFEMYGQVVIMMCQVSGMPRHAICRGRHLHYFAAIIFFRTAILEYS